MYILQLIFTVVLFIVIAFLFLVFLLIICKICVNIQYVGKITKIHIKLGFLKLNIYPSKLFNKNLAPKSIEKPKKANNLKNKTNKKSKKIKDTSNFSLKNLDIDDLLETIFNIIYDLNGKLHIDKLYLKLVFAGNDAAKGGLMLGLSFSILGIFLPILKENFCIKNEKIILDCDFNSSKTILDFEFVSHFRIISILKVFLTYFPKFFYQYKRLKKQ